MDRAKPAVIRNALSLAHEYAKAGLSFVCVPVDTDEQNQQAVEMAARNLDTMIKDSEQSE